MLDAWLQRTRQSLAAAESLIAIPEQEFALWALARAVKPGVVAAPAVCVWGEAESGKSSLVRQVLRQHADYPRRKFLLVDAAEWSEFLAATNLGRDAALKKGDVVVCENLQALAERRDDTDRLADWMDRARAKGQVVIVTSDRLPSQIDDVSSRLANRLQGGLLAGIRPLSDATLEKLRSQWASPSGSKSRRTWPAGITTAGQLKRHLAEAPESSVPQRRLSLDAIATAVAGEFQVPLADLCAGLRTQPLKVPRGVAMVLARELTSSSLMTIARHFGCQSHTSVVRGCARLMEQLAEDAALRHRLQRLRTGLCQELSAECG